VIGERRSPSLLLGREVQGQRNWPDSWIRRVARSECTPTLIERGELSSISDICMSLCNRGHRDLLFHVLLIPRTVVRAQRSRRVYLVSVRVLWLGPEAKEPPAQQLIFPTRGVNSELGATRGLKKDFYLYLIYLST
jgi:hypothetical protein